MLLIDVAMEMLILLCQFDDILPYKVNPRAIYDIVSISIAWNAFMDIFSILLDHFLFYVHESVIIITTVLQGRKKTLFFKFVSNREDLGLGNSLVSRLGDEIDPSNNGIFFIVWEDGFSEGGILEIISKLLNVTVFNEPKLSLVWIPWVEDMFGGKDDFLHELGKFEEGLGFKLLHDGSLAEDVDIIGLEECFLKIRG